MNEQTSPILQYAQMIRDLGQEHREVQAYFKRHSKDKDFARRAEVLHKLMSAKSVPLGSAAAVR